MRHLLYTVLPAVIFIAGCVPTKNITEVPQEKNYQEYLIGSTLWTQHSGEYKALCYQAYHIAGENLIHKLDSQVQKPAVVLDLDETVLDNSPYTAWQIQTGNAYSDETWEKWTDLAIAEAVPGSVAFLKMADSLGVTLIYITNRLRINALNSTIDNMKKLGIPQADEAHLLLKTTTSDKTARRDSILAQGYNVLLYIGDNLGDFSAIWDRKANAERNADVAQQKSKFGRDYIVLPNAIYGTWESASYNFNRNLTEHQVDSIRKAALIPAKL